MAPRMRTIDDAAAIVREMDPDTAVTPRALRRLVSEGTIPSVSVGRKRLVNVDLVLTFLGTGTAADERPSACELHPIPEKARG